jgi:multiple sugar transport system substrate-binding protein
MDRTRLTGRLLALWYALFILLIFSSGCDIGSNPATVVEFWVMGREGEAVGALLPEFERRYPDIRVRVQQIPWRAAHEKLLTAYAGDAMPDLFQLGNTWIPEFVAIHAIEPLDARVTSSSGVVAEDYFSGIWETNRVEGHLYGVPWYIDTRLIFYRKDILEQAGYTELPRTWTRWLEAMSRIKQRLGKEHYAILLPLTEWQQPVILALQQGAELLSDEAQYGNFQSRPFREAYSFYLDLFRQNLAPAVGETQITNLYRDFANGHFAMLITGPWNLGEFERRLPPTLQGKWATAPLPGPDEDHPGVSLAGGASLTISRASRHKDAVWKFIEYLSEPESQSAFYRLTGDLPARRSAWEKTALIDHPQARAFWDQLQLLRSTPKIPEWERIASQIARYSEAVVRERMTTDEALAALDRTVDDLLEKRRWLWRRAWR